MAKESKNKKVEEVEIEEVEAEAEEVENKKNNKSNSKKKEDFEIEGALIGEEIFGKKIIKSYEKKIGNKMVIEVLVEDGSTTIYE